MSLPKTINELRTSEYKTLSVKEEIKKNLVRRLKDPAPLFPEIVGYDASVIPQIINAQLSFHNMLLLGERGQAKSRILRSLVSLLDPLIPAIKGCEINDNPFSPLCKICRELVSKYGDGVEIEWIERERRYGEKLATPDVAIGDLIGDVDPIKVAEGRYLSDELTIHFGLIPRTNRGIFAINELQDLPERVQVGLFNIMEEGDIQIKGYRIRLPLDILIVATENPEDYTNRGRIITPLKDRFEAQIRTHYPRERNIEVKIMENESKIKPHDGLRLVVPGFMKDIISEITFQARRSPDINQKAGVSVRMTISNYETLLANAERRSIILGEKDIVPRICDLYYLPPSTNGKIELEYTGKEDDETEIVHRFIRKSIKAVFDEYFNPDDFKNVIEVFKKGATMDVSDIMPAVEYFGFLKEFPEFKTKLSVLGLEECNGAYASATEFILESLYLHNLLSKNIVGNKYHYIGSSVKKGYSE